MRSRLTLFNLIRTLAFVLMISFLAQTMGFNLYVDVEQRNQNEYFIHDSISVLNEIQELVQNIRVEELSIPINLRPQGFYPRSARLALRGLVLPDSSWSEEVPDDIGTVLVHHVYLGEFRLVTGWQWAGRLEGLPGAQQIGFVRLSEDQ